MFKTIEKNASGLYIEKKSKFIANIFYIESVCEAEKIIEKTRKKYYDARHNCYAYRVIEDECIIERQSDDGDPSGTAGGPILNILEKKGYINVLVIVTRYFGGILLGTGGLVRAYTEATNDAMQKAKEIEKEKGYIVQVISEYENQREFEYICEKNNVNIINKEYTDKVKNLIEISEKKYSDIFQENQSENIRKLLIKIKEHKYILKMQ